MSTNTLGRYKIIREIARSNDVVYEAVDTSINRRIALKELLLPPNLAGAQKRERVERFYREARAAGSLTHPNIVTIFEAGEDHGRHFIAMEYLEGQTLRQVLEIEGKLPIDRALDILKQVANGLAYAHSKSIVHRDIKPDNIQILPGNQVKITDFGIARIMEEPTLTADGQVFGTPSYMSPEQVAGKHLDNRSDIFSLGIVLFEMVTGRKPFVGDSVVTITYNIMNQDINIPPSVPLNIERVIRRALAKDPNMRYSTTTEMVEDLESTAPQAGPYTYPQYQQPDPTNVTISAPGPFYGPATAAPPPAQPGMPSSMPDPFANLKPGDLSLPSLPRQPRQPILSAEAKYFLKVMVVVMLSVGAFILFAWVFSLGYQGYQQQTNMDVIQRHMKAGTDYYNQQSYQSALEEFSAALSLTTDSQLQAQLKHNIASCYIAMGDDAYNQRNVDLAGDWWDKALQTDPRDGEALDRAAMVYLIWGNQAEQAGDMNAALEWWKKAKDTSPGSNAGQEAMRKLQAFLPNLSDSNNQ